MALPDSARHIHALITILDPKKVDAWHDIVSA